MSEDNVKVVSDLLDGFTSGDIAKAVGAFHAECVVHEAESLPYGGDWNGPDEVMKLFSTMGAAFEVTMHKVDLYDCGGDKVLMHGDATYTSRATGRSLRTSMMEFHTIQDGKIIYSNVFYQDTRSLLDLLA